MRDISFYDLVVVGHFAIDIIVKNGEAMGGALGGPPTYASLAASKMGAKVSIISKVGDDFPEEHIKFLSENGIDLTGLKVVKDARTTNYVLAYEDGERKLVLKARAPDIALEDIPPDLVARSVLLAPIAGEIGSPVVAELRRRTECLCLDPQGFVRKFLDDGTVVLTNWFDRSILSNVDILKASMREYECIMGRGRFREGLRRLHRLGISIIVITLGEEGSIISVRNRLYAIPSYQVKAVETTGAGDAYIGAFLAEYARGEDPVWCACVGSAAASFTVEDFGPRRFGDREGVVKRAQEIYENVVEV
ncbi:hypothetical protein B6U66_04390 [Candidatus Bathyarchaeota archaeon ex4484_135]|nr:MAG: hypothetical protein B6U66_04390 [Candidatus Bathyarchaeota archaeon ex4484_135]